MKYLWLALWLCSLGLAQAAETIIVTAEGLADPNADTYKRDQGLLIDALRQDARKQAIEKAVGTFVDSSTLVANYTLISDKVLTRSQGLIKQVIKESPHWIGKDGFAHMLIKAEVYLTDLQTALKEMSRESRVALIKEQGSPKISVAVIIRDAERGGDAAAERSPVAENILKEHISKFGYRVWSEDVTRTLRLEQIERSQLANQTETTVSVSQMKASDFTIVGEAKFEKRSIKLAASGITVSKYILTSWTVKCVDNHTGEEIYFNNKIPRKQSWESEDQALGDVGRMIGGEFSKDFFEQHLMQPSSIYQVQVSGLPSYDAGTLLKKEFVGLRPVLNVEFRNFNAKGFSLFEVEFTGRSDNFAALVDGVIIKPLNAKFGEKVFKLDSVNGKVVELTYNSSMDVDELMQRFDRQPPASLALATPERIQQVVQSKETMTQVAKVNPEAVSALSKGGNPAANSALDAARNF